VGELQRLLARSWINVVKPATVRRTALTHGGNCWDQAKPLIDGRLCAIVEIIPEKRRWQRRFSRTAGSRDSSRHADFPLQIRALKSTSGMMPKLIPDVLFKAGGRFVALPALTSETWGTHFRVEFAS
jgi:hypothetical protein